MADKADVEIEITPAAKPAGVEIPETEIEIEGGGGGDSKSPKAAAVTDDDIAALQRELVEAKAKAKRSSEAEAFAHQRSAEVEGRAREIESKLGTEVEARLKAQEDTIVSGVDAVNGEIKALRESIAQLQADGKWSEAAEAIENMADAKARLREFNSQKAQIDNYRENLKRAPKQEGPVVGAKTQAWIAAHPKFSTDRLYNAKAMFLHEEAIAKGHAPESDGYFDYIETGLGEREPAVTPEDKPQVPQKPQAKPSAPVAPVQRRAETPNPRANANKITLTGEEVEQADSLFGEPGTPLYIKDPKERYTYWHSQKNRLKEEGRLQ